ncbi:hypothetical protein [Zoogloea sp.]|uniref:hypothetical protein n=1 Tax=Zoogloea sp. TaxID=49181 RepID=UPI002FDFE436
MMKNPMRFSAFGRHFTSVLMVTALGGCAGVNFYADPALKNPTGIPIYGSKPYLLVVRTKSEEKPIDVSILYLPDPSKVIYADPRSGFGTAKLTLNLTQGQMTSFGQDIDMKVPELLGAFTGVLTGRATAAKTLAEADQIKAAIPKTAQSSELLDATVLDKIKNLYSDLDGPVFKSELASLDGSQVAIINTLKLNLKTVIDNANKPAKKAMLDAAVATLPDDLKTFSKLPDPPNPSGPTSPALQRIKVFKGVAAEILKTLTPKEAEPADVFELYEIVQDTLGNATTFRRVK